MQNCACAFTLTPLYADMSKTSHVAGNNRKVCGYLLYLITTGELHMTSFPVENFKVLLLIYIQFASTNITFFFASLHTGLFTSTECFSGGICT